MMPKAATMAALTLVGSLGCAATPSKTRAVAPVVAPAAAEAPTVTPPVPSDESPATPAPGARDEAPKDLIVFVASPSCTSLEPTSTGVPATDATPRDAVRTILRSPKVTGARIPVKDAEVRVESGVARVDLHVAEGARKDLHALSRCESFALLGAIARTLKSHPTWGIRGVVFTQRGDLLAIES